MPDGRLHTNTSTLAGELTEFLIRPDRYSHESPLQKLVQKKIEALANEVADSIVSGTPDLLATVQARTTAVVAALIVDEGWLEKATVAAVSKALAKQREMADNE